MARILVVDDERLLRTLTVEVGSSLGHEVFTAANIRDGLALARQERGRLTTIKSFFEVLS